MSKKLVLALMRQLGFKSKVRIRRTYHSYQGHVSRIAPNVLARDFTAQAPGQKLVSDVTEFRVANRKLYLSPVLDLYDHTVVAHTMSTSPSTALTSESLKLALATCQPGPGVIVHTDQGFQYQHSSWRKLIEENKAVQSMSRKGNCYDNSVMENFFGHLKAEMYHGEHFNSVEELTTEIATYIDWYNTERIQERLGGMTPMQYRSHAPQTSTA